MLHFLFFVLFNLQYYHLSLIEAMETPDIYLLTSLWSERQLFFNADVIKTKFVQIKQYI